MNNASHYANEMNKYKKLIDENTKIKNSLEVELTEKQKIVDQINKSNIIGELSNSISNINSTAPLFSQCSKLMQDIVLTGTSFDNGELSEISNKLLEFEPSLNSLKDEISQKKEELEKEITELNNQIYYYGKEIQTYKRLYDSASSNYRKSNNNTSVATEDNKNSGNDSSFGGKKFFNKNTNQLA